MATKSHRGQALTELAFILFLLTVFLFFSFGVDTRVNDDAEKNRFGQRAQRLERFSRRERP